MANPKAPVLDNLADSEVIGGILVNTIYESLGIKDELRFADLGWREGSLGHFIHSVAKDISAHINEAGVRIGKKSFRSFDVSKTKFTKEMIEELWLVASQAIAERMDVLYRSQNAEVPNLRESIEKGIFFPGRKAPYKMHTAEHLAYGKSERKRMLASLENVNNAPELLARFRNNYFEYVQKEFQVFDEPSAETRQEFGKLK